MAELYDMTQARLRADWDGWSSLMALIANCNRDPKKHGPYRAENFHPFRRASAASAGVPLTVDNIGLLKSMAKLPATRNARKVVR